MERPSRLPLEDLEGRAPASGRSSSGGRGGPGAASSPTSSPASPSSPKILMRMTSFRKLFSRGASPSSSRSSNGSGGDSPKSTVSETPSPTDSPKGDTIPKEITPTGELPKPRPLASSRIEDGYTITAMIGYGSNARVYLAYPDGNRDEDPVAIKSIQLAEPTARMHGEAEILASEALGKHPNLMHVARYYTTSERLCLVMPYYGADLLGYLRLNKDGLPWQTRKNLFAGLINGLYFMHSNQFVHLDVKLENVMLDMNDGPRAVLGDFGFSKHVIPATTLLEDWRGSDHYSCPQILTHTPYIGKLADAWSAGVCIYALMYSRLPWGDPRRNMRLILEGDYPKPDVFVPPQAATLLSRLLTADERRRGSVGEAKTSSWFVGY